jgi:hypothetical protein
MAGMHECLELFLTFCPRRDAVRDECQCSLLALERVVIRSEATAGLTGAA